MAVYRKRSSERIDVYEVVTDQVVKLLEAGTIPWRRPWKGRLQHPQNAKSGAHYRGINPFILEVARLTGGWTDHRWLTFKQAKDAGGNVRKGEKSTLVVFWNWYDKKNAETGETDRFPVLKYFRVFNIEQTENVDESRLKADGDTYEPTEWEAIEAAESVASDWLGRSGITYEERGVVAAYRPADDSLMMPDRDRFEVPSEFYSVLFHELTHATGHGSRLDRLDSSTFGSEAYGREELVAEMGSAFLCGHCGIEAQTIQNSAAYISGWLKVLKSDKRLIASAAAAAQRAADLILGKSFGQPEAAEPQVAQV